MPLSLAQQQVATSTKRFRVCVAGRRFGKTYLSIRELCKHSVDVNRECIYVAPSYKMAKNIVWRPLKRKLDQLHWIRRTNETELSIDLVNGSRISLKGADNYDSLRGTGNHFIVLDEFADIAPEAWYETLRATLSDTEGKALFIGTPKGRNWAFDIYNKHREDQHNWASWQFSTIEGGRVTEEEIAQAQRDLDARTFRQEYMATFETFAGVVYYAFDPDRNVIDAEPTSDDVRVIYVGMDFNIDPMTAVVCIRKGEDICVIDEIRMYSSNTQETVAELRARYATSKIWVYPDPAAHARKTSAGGATDITILQNAGFIVKAPRSHTPVRDRINAVNSRLCSTDGQRRLFVAKRCKYTIEGLSRLTYKEGTSQPDKSSGFDHITDALGYLVDYVYPVRKDMDPDAVRPQRWGHKIGTY